MSKLMKQRTLNKDKVWQFIRFCIVGVIAAGIHYGVYYLLMSFINVNISYTLGYVVSLFCNFFLTSYLTFRSVPSIKKALGFGGSHLLNYLLHIALFNLLLYLDISPRIAPVLVMAIVVPINFLLLRWVFTHKQPIDSDEVVNI